MFFRIKYLEIFRVKQQFKLIYYKRFSMEDILRKMLQHVIAPTRLQ